MHAFLVFQNKIKECENQTIQDLVDCLGVTQYSDANYRIFFETMDQFELTNYTWLNTEGVAALTTFATSQNILNKKININFNNPGGARFIVLDAYMRYTDKFLDALRNNLTELKNTHSGKKIFETTIEEVSGIPIKAYVKQAAKAQKEMILKNKKD